ncbi:hypothetical protein DD238_004074 [Peronospora effusa]|uniref:RXLR phytopathogen effector protein WY-domain domain-containing protein n=1 Tax=Peronospora effusa TaxID=542832 RepID=A0A3M6VR44_9STRA|nr:hypothetical protein DD238_004074 [Peronospora effusa]
MGVGAHAEPDAVTTDGHYEVQRQLRVQEREHGEDVEERMDGLNFGEGFMNAAEESESMILNSAPLEGESVITYVRPDTLKRHADIVESGLRSAKKRKSVVTQFLSKAAEAESLNTYTKDGEKPNISFDDVMSHFKKEDKAMLLTEANEDMLNIPLNPDDVFKLYGLNFAGDALFIQQQLPYWVKYVDAFNAQPGKKAESLFVRLREFYRIEDLVVAVTRVPKDKIALRVEAQIGEYWLQKRSTPGDVFTALRLDTDINPYRFHFWMKYFTHYNSEGPETSKVSMYLELKKHLDSSSLRTLLTRVRKSDVTQSLEKDLENSLLESWSKEKIPVEDVIQASKLMEEKEKQSVYGSAVQKATVEYIFYIPKKHV